MSSKSLRLHASGMAVLTVVAVLSMSSVAFTASSKMVHVAGDPSPASLPGTVTTGTTAASTPETIAFILRAQNLGQLESSAEGRPTSFLTVPEFAAEYGQPSSNVTALEKYLASYGITTKAYADRLDVVATGTAAEFNKALDDKQADYRVPRQAAKGGSQPIAAQSVHAATAAPSLPQPIAGSVLAVLGLSNYGPFSTPLVHTTVSGAKGSAAAPYVNDCELLTDLPSACNTPDDFASNYGLTGLYTKGDHGQGATLAIVTLAAVDPGAPQYFWKNIAGLTPSGRTLKVDNIDGGPGTPTDASGTGETDLDLEQSGSLAPDANVIDYQAPNTDPGFADAFFTAASQNIADSISSSWGESETIVAAAVASGEETPAYEAAFDEAFMESAVQGQSMFVSAGDEAAYDASGDLGTTNLSVDTPGDSPFVTSAGGTTLPWTGTLVGPTGITASVNVPKQRAWGWDYLWQPMATIGSESLETAAEANVAGGGGGYSAVESEPPYQYGVSGINSYSAVPYLTPTDEQNVDGIEEPTEWAFNPTPTTITGSNASRVQPDVSADADPFTGYLLYEPSFAGVSKPELQGGWGGTSFVAPQLNGSTAVIDSAVGHRVGFWNPSIYAFATGGGSPFKPLDTSGTSNDNLYYTGTPGTVYNPATGLGTPNLTKLATDFANVG
jgi:kumamolisin